MKTKIKLKKILSIVGVLFIHTLVLSQSQQPPCGDNPAPGNTCEEAPLICNLDGYCGQTLSSYTADYWGTPTTSIFSQGTGLIGGFTNVANNKGCGTGATIENNSFLKFIADASNVELGIWVGNCSSGNSWISGVQVHIFKLNEVCGQGNITNVYCKSQFTPTTSGSQTISMSGLTPGETYYIMIDGFEGDVCDYTFTAESGISVGMSVSVSQNEACPGEVITASVAGAEGDIEWTGEGISSTTGENITITAPSEPGVYTYTVSSEGAGGCGGEDEYEFSITVNPESIPQFTNPGTICVGDSFTLPNTSNDGITGSWSSPVNTSIIGETEYTFTPNAGQCAIETTIIIEVADGVIPEFDNIGPVCVGENISLPSNSLNGINGTWTPAFNSSQTTEYTFTPDESSCAVETTMIIEVTDDIIPTFTNPGPVCEGEVFNLPTTSENGVNGTWSPALNYTETTEYFFTPNENESCASATSMTVEVTSEIIPVFDEIGPFCEGATFSLPSTSINGVHGTWSPEINNQETMVYTFIPNSDESCATETQITVTIVSNPTADFEFSPEHINSENNHVSFSNHSTGGNFYQWDFGDGIGYSNEENPTYTYDINEEEGFYTITLTVSNDFGCTSTIEKTIQIVQPESDYYFPNIFTPNGDGQNDVFKLINPKNIAYFDLLILNRWGNVVYQTDEVNFQWNGKVNNTGADCTDGVYFYKATIRNYNNIEKTEQGYLHLNRGK